MNQHLYALQIITVMKFTASKNNKKTILKFEKFVLSSLKMKNVKGGNDPILMEDVLSL